MKPIADDGISGANQGLALRRLLRQLGPSVNASTETLDATTIQKHLREHHRVVKAAYDALGGDLPKTLHWFRTEQLAPFGHKTAEQLVAAGQGDDVIRLIDSLHAGAAG